VFRSLALVLSMSGCDPTHQDELSSLRGQFAVICGPRTHRWPHPSYWSRVLAAFTRAFDGLHRP
jgi:hypothetical protein